MVTRVQLSPARPGGQPVQVSTLQFRTGCRQERLRRNSQSMSNLSDSGSGAFRKQLIELTPANPPASSSASCSSAISSRFRLLRPHEPSGRGWRPRRGGGKARDV